MRRRRRKEEEQEEIPIPFKEGLRENECMPKKSKTGSNEKGAATTCIQKGIVTIKKKTGEHVKDQLNKAEEESMNNDAYIKVHDILPNCGSYIVTHCESIDENKWSATIRAKIESESDAANWLGEFEDENHLNFRVQWTVNCKNSKRLVSKRHYRCHHNTMPRKNTKLKAANKETSRNHNSKNTDCPAYVKITIKKTTMLRSSDFLLQTYPCEINIRHTHNHPIKCAEALKRLRPCKATCEKFTDLLQRGYSPSAALECHKFDLQIEHGEDYYKISGDQSQFPSNSWVNKLYNKLRIQQYGPQTGEKMFESLKRFCDDYNEECQSECAKVEIVDGVHLVVTVCTPLMKRASRLLKSAAEILFADSSGTMDCLNCKLFLLQTCSVAGAIPLGALIVTSESERVLSVAFTSWKSLLPEDAFYGRGANVGPKLIMTDDCASERNALKTAFSDCVLLLCLFHVLQAFWRFIWNRERNVNKEDRGELFFLFRDIVYAENNESFYKRLNVARNNNKLKKYPKVLEHIEKLVLRAPEWALYFRKNLLSRGHNTNNFSEAGIRVFKDKILNRSKAFNTVHLLEFVLRRYDFYLKNRIIDSINNRALNAFKSRFYVHPDKLQDLTCKKMEALQNTYIVRNTSKGTEYSVIMDIEICSCPAGQSGAPCKHMSAVVSQFKLHSTIIHPQLQCHNFAIKKLLFEVVHGHNNVKEEWFANLRCQSEKTENASVASTSNASIIDDAEYSVIPECAQNSVKTFPTEEVNKLKKCLDLIFSRFKRNLEEKLELFVDAIKAFVCQDEKLSHSETGQLSALHTYGKQYGTLPIGYKNKRSGSVIPVQPTSKARRTQAFGCKQTGRPPKTKEYVDDHNYHKKKRTPNEPVWWGVPRRGKEAAPHSITQNITHWKKKF